MTEREWKYHPRDQFIDFHRRGERWAAVVAHRRCGKTVACICDLILSAVRHKRQEPRGQFAYIAPLYRQAKQVSWDYLKSYALDVNPRAEISESELRVDFPAMRNPETGEMVGGGRVRLFGADNPDSLRGVYLDGVVLDEVADMSPRIQEVIRPALSDYQGWAVYIGTPRGQNDFYDLIHGTPNWVGAKADPEWFFREFKASETGLLAPEELESAKKQLTPEQYEQEYECSFSAAILGAYYGREMEEAERTGRITSGLYDRNAAVHTAWDLGHSDSTAIWFYQQDGYSIRIIDFYAASNRGLDHYVSVLQERGIRPGRDDGYKYGSHFLPHDVKQSVLGMDKTRLASLYAMGMQSLIVVPKLSVDEGINAVRKILPRCWFEREKCQEGMKALRQYRREYDDTRKVFYEKPYHDWASDAADAFRYLALGLREPITAGAAKELPKRNMGWIY